ncbi:hypothetical protein [Nostoc sp.]
MIQRERSQDFFWKSTIRDLDESDWEERRLDIYSSHFPQKLV